MQWKRKTLTTTESCNKGNKSEMKEINKIKKKINEIKTLRRTSQVVQGRFTEKIQGLILSRYLTVKKIKK